MQTKRLGTMLDLSSEYVQTDGEILPGERTTNCRALG